MTDHKTRIIAINNIEANHIPSPSVANKWSAVLEKFNPLGSIADMYARTLAYKIETKRLDAELQRMEAQAALAHDVIDKTFQLKMAELANRRVELIGFYQSFNNQLQELSIARAKVLEMAQLAQQQSFAQGISLEDRQMYKDMTMELVRELPKFADQANCSLQQLVQALPTVQMPPKLLSE
jgi:predicted ABC-class ATPase